MLLGSFVCDGRQLFLIVIVPDARACHCGKVRRVLGLVGRERGFGVLPRLAADQHSKLGE